MQSVEGKPAPFSQPPVAPTRHNQRWLPSAVPPQAPLHLARGCPHTLFTHATVETEQVPLPTQEALPITQLNEACTCIFVLQMSLYGAPSRWQALLRGTKCTAVNNPGSFAFIGLRVQRVGERLMTKYSTRGQESLRLGQEL